jgi:hypothetical protein
VRTRQRLLVAEKCRTADINDRVGYDSDYDNRVNNGANNRVDAGLDHSDFSGDNAGPR